MPTRNYWRLPRREEHGASNFMTLWRDTDKKEIVWVS